jgi:hypothetical protein
MIGRRVSVIGHVLRDALERAASAVSLSKAAAARCGSEAPASRKAETVPAAADDDALDRERQLRVLMSSWM